MFSSFILPAPLKASSVWLGRVIQETSYRRFSVKRSLSNSYKVIPEGYVRTRPPPRRALSRHRRTVERGFRACEFRTWRRLGNVGRSGSTKIRFCPRRGLLLSAACSECLHGGRGRDHLARERAGGGSREGDVPVAVVGQIEIAASGADLLYGADPVSGQGDLQGSARLGDLALELLTL